MPYGDSTRRLTVEQCDHCGWDGYVRPYRSLGGTHWVCPSCLSTALPRREVAATS